MLRLQKKGFQTMKKSLLIGVAAIAVVAATPVNAQIALGTTVTGAGVASQSSQVTQTEAVNSGDEVIVTGTRTTGLRASDSAAPIQVLGADALKRVGQPDLNSALAQQLPSIQIQTAGADQAIFHPAVKLRGLSPNHTLVEINGKRRHGTSNVVVSGGAFGGGAAPDLSLIPEDAIDHIEVLQDGAAAQYGTDAIAGVVNFILKKNKGLSFNATGGHYFDDGGARYDLMGRVGFEPVENGYISLTVERSFRNYAFRGDVDPRVANTSNAAVAARLATYPGILNYPNYPYVNRIPSDAQQTLTNGLYNAGYSVTPDLEVYSFGTYSHRIGRAYENYRLPTVVVGKAATDIPFPAGFSPQEVTVETDYAATGGIRGEFGGTTFDLSSTYGNDNNRSNVERSSNAALYYDTSNFTTVNGITTYIPGQSPTNFYDGSFISTQWSNTLDLTHKFDIGLANPLNVAGGLEYRRESYQLVAGDPASYYVSPYVGGKGGGAQSFFGYSPANASDHHRNNFSEYLDLSLKPVDAATIDAAVRHEHYSDFGNTTVFKITGRYDFSPVIAVRGTVSTGFRAPTLAEEFYSGINVGPTNISGVLAPNSTGAAFLGLSGLKPEKSTNFSAGLVLHPVPGLLVTIDGYYIKIRDRIVQSGTFYGADYNLGKVVPGTIVSASVLTALRNNGVPVDAVIASLIGPPAQTGNVSAQAFVNGVSTRTQGVDMTASYASDFGDFGHVDWSLTGNYNSTKITKVNAPPSNVNPAVILLDPNAQTLLTNSTPKFRVTAGAYWTISKFTINLRESFYSKTSTLNSDPTTGLYTDTFTITNKFITDLEAGYQVTKSVKVSAGANNLFNKYPNKIPDSYRTQQYNSLNNGYVTKYPSFSPIGVDGGYYYGRLSVNF